MLGPAHAEVLAAGGVLADEVGDAAVVWIAALASVRSRFTALSAMVSQLRASPTTRRGTSEALARQLGPDGVKQFVREYLDGATAKELAAKHTFGTTATKRLVKRHGARKR